MDNDDDICGCLIIFIFIMCFCMFVTMMCGCYDDGDYGYYGNQCDAGDIVCENNKIKICNADGYYETYQDCGAVNKKCSVLAYECSGYVNNACCY